MSTRVVSDNAAWTLEDADCSRSLFSVEGIRCASCARSIERAVGALPGIAEVGVNVATGRVSVKWRPDKIDLLRILKTVELAGFKPLSHASDAATAELQRERRLALKRIGLAGLGSMQVMMYVFGLYFGKSADMDPATASLLRYTGMLITLPVLLYSGAPFFTAAWRDVRRRSLGMDVPVALALLLAFAASVYNTFRGMGQTYFDSVTMFIFFLSAGRFAEMTLRKSSLSATEALGRSLPATVMRVKEDQSTERIAIREIDAHDRLIIPRGAVIPVDARLAEGTAYIDESLITGESTPLRRNTGDPLLGGSINTSDAIQVLACKTVESSTLASIVGLVERAQSSRPPIALAADRAASWFVGALLIVAALTAAIWFTVDSAHAFSATLAVLVVSCPCALSLATPAATAAVTAHLARLGILVTRPDTLERLAKIDTVILDKTGTLTTGDVRVARTTVVGGHELQSLLAIAAALERASNHPIARAFSKYAKASVTATDVREVPGQGVAGEVNGERWRIGRHDFAAALADSGAGTHTVDSIALANGHGVVATFDVCQEIRPQAAAAVRKLEGLGLQVLMASGDRLPAVTHTAQSLGIDRATAEMTPEAKLALVERLQSGGRRALMVGDGINDGPVLAAAHVSCAMGEGSAVAHAAADLLLLNESLECLAEGVRSARRMFTVIHQNLGWSLVYNFSMVPLAALDILPPWVAALGMSLSSLLVVLNARRLTHKAAP